MKTILHQALRALIAAVPGWLQPAALLGIGLGALFALLFRRVRSEDRIAGLEAALCREQTARNQADEALAEADLVLARMAARANGDYIGDPAGQLVIIQAELTQIQQRCGADQPIRDRLELLRCRLDRLGNSLRNKAPAAEPG